MTPDPWQMAFYVVLALLTAREVQHWLAERNWRYVERCLLDRVQAGTLRDYAVVRPEKREKEAEKVRYMPSGMQQATPRPAAPDLSAARSIVGELTE